jgi:hypothetical protein
MIIMRKRQMPPTPQIDAPQGQAWLDVDRIASVEVTSEQSGYPIEFALMGENGGWRAANPGIQTVRIVFDRPQELRRIWLVFEDSECARTQEFVLRWSRGQEPSFREIVRQPWNFSPGGSVRESEDYKVNLSEVTVLELTIVPNKSGGEARASLQKFRLA